MNQYFIKEQFEHYIIWGPYCQKKNMTTSPFPLKYKMGPSKFHNVRINKDQWIWFTNLYIAIPWYFPCTLHNVFQKTNVNKTRFQTLTAKFLRSNKALQNSHGAIINVWEGCIYIQTLFHLIYHVIRYLNCYKQKLSMNKRKPHTPECAKFA